MSNQKKNPIFWYFIAVLAGIALLIGGNYRNDAIGSYKGAGAMLWAGGILLACGLGGWFIYKRRKR